MNTRRLAAASTALTCVLFVGACSSGDDTVVDEQVTDEHTADTEYGADLIAQFDTCADDVAPAVADHIDGLVLSDTSGVNEFGISCTWESPVDTTDPGNVRVIDVSLSPGTGIPVSPEELTAPGIEVVPDVAIEALGGYAYTVPEVTASTGVEVVQIELPEIQIAIAGSRTDAGPTIDAAAAVAAAKELAGL